MDEIGVVFVDVLKAMMWSAGVLVRQFELGRSGQLPEFASKEGKEAIHQHKKRIENKRERETNESNKSKEKRFPMGFA